MKKIVIFVAAVFLISVTLYAAYLYTNSLTFKIQKALQGKDCTVSAAMISGRNVFTFNNKKAPLMSVFKYFIALRVLNKIENGSLSLNDKIIVTNSMIDKNTYSPMLKIYSPPFKINIETLLEYMVAESDNNACDILLSYIGGVSGLQKYLDSIGYNRIEILATEKMMWDDFNNEYLNKAYPIDVINLMKTVRKDNILSEKSKKFLDEIMIETTTGANKLKAGLPKDVIIGHKTGSSSRKPDGVKIADNDAGFVILPNGKTYYIAVFVTESKMTDEGNAALIAEISNIIYKHAVSKKPIYNLCNNFILHKQLL